MTREDFDTTGAGLAVIPGGAPNEIDAVLLPGQAVLVVADRHPAVPRAGLGVPDAPAVVDPEAHSGVVAETATHPVIFPRRDSVLLQLAIRAGHVVGHHLLAGVGALD